MLGERIEESPTIDSKDFLSETDYLNQSLSCANKYKAKISLITSLRLNRELSNIINNDASTKTKSLLSFRITKIWRELLC